jgi:hypothetical protein
MDRLLLPVLCSRNRVLAKPVLSCSVGTSVLRRPSPEVGRVAPLRTVRARSGNLTGVAGPAHPSERDPTVETTARIGDQRARRSARPGRAQDHRVPAGKVGGQNGSAAWDRLGQSAARSARPARGHTRSSRSFVRSAHPGITVRARVPPFAHRIPCPRRPQRPARPPHSRPFRASTSLWFGPATAPPGPRIGAMPRRSTRLARTSTRACAARTWCASWTWRRNAGRGRPPPRESGVRPRQTFHLWISASLRCGGDPQDTRWAVLRDAPTDRRRSGLERYRLSGSRARSRSRPAAPRHRCPCRIRPGCSSRRRSSAARRRPRGPPRSAGPGCCGTG